MAKMKKYDVWFITKRNNHGYLHKHEAIAENQKIAIKLIKECCRIQYQAHAFSVSTKTPEVMEDGVVYLDMLYPKAQAVNEKMFILW